MKFELKLSEESSKNNIVIIFMKKCPTSYTVYKRYLITPAVIYIEFLAKFASDLRFLFYLQYFFTIHVIYMKLPTKKNKKHKEESSQIRSSGSKSDWCQVGGTFFNINSTHKLFVISFMFTKKKKNLN